MSGRYSDDDRGDADDAENGDGQDLVRGDAEDLSEQKREDLRLVLGGLAQNSAPRASITTRARAVTTSWRPRRPSAPMPERGEHREDARDRQGC